MIFHIKLYGFFLHALADKGPEGTFRFLLGRKSQVFLGSPSRSQFARFLLCLIAEIVWLYASAHYCEGLKRSFVEVFVEPFAGPEPYFFWCGV